MFYYILYSLIIVIVAVFVVGMLFRKKIYREVDKLELWKNDILNRAIPEEIGKVKTLHMSGETEERFELWRSEWDEIVGTILPDIEEELFNIEEFANKYRFKRSKNLIDLLNNRLNSIEEQLKVMLGDIQTLVESEEKNRNEIGEIRTQFENLEKELIRKRGSFGQTIKSLDTMVENIKKVFSNFDEATNKGNYLKARGLLTEVQSQLTLLQEYIEKVPSLLVQIQVTIPNECKNLRLGIQEMEDSGYYLKSYEFENQIQMIDKELEDFTKDIQKLELEGLEEKLTKLSEKIDSMYGLLEDEVDSKKQVTEQIPVQKENLLQLDDKLQKLMAETNHVQLSYRITDDELKKQENIRKKLQDLTKQLQVIVDVTENEKQTFTSIQDMLEQWGSSIVEVKTNMEEAKARLDTLREDEWKAKETIVQLKQVLVNSKRMIRKSNIPGLPVHVMEKLKQGEEIIKKTTAQLEQVPLEMGRVNALINDAVKMVKDNEESILATIDEAELAEKLIQYGNRYRSQSEGIYEALTEAEKLFRDYHYEEAIEVTISAVKKYDPNVENKFVKEEEVTAS
ncbi:septation ring formation regulator EzrA [Bacillus sp. TS-2]|nr:septation ring formation regulator EzrA [Bacillus sp. TS-2]